MAALKFLTPAENRQYTVLVHQYQSAGSADTPETQRLLDFVSKMQKKYPQNRDLWKQEFRLRKLTGQPISSELQKQWSAWQPERVRALQETKEAPTKTPTLRDRLAVLAKSPYEARAPVPVGPYPLTERLRYAQIGEIR